MKEIQAPSRIICSEEDGFKVFLAGSIEMGKADNWQKIRNTINRWEYC